MSNRDRRVPMQRPDAQPPAPAAPASVSTLGQGSKQLQFEPIATLLPATGSVHELHAIRDELAENLRSLQECRAASSEIDVRAQAAEESMLQQALQWLAAGKEG